MKKHLLDCVHSVGGGEGGRGLEVVQQLLGQAANLGDGGRLQHAAERLQRGRQQRH